MNKRILTLDEFINEAKATEQKLIGKKVSFQGADVCPIIDQGTVGELSKKYRDKMPKESQKQCDSFDQEETAVACMHRDKMVTVHSLADIASKSHQKIIEAHIDEGANKSMDATVKKVFDYIIKNYEENVIVTRDFVEDVAKKMNLNLDDEVINKVLVQFGVNPMDESDESEKIWTSGMSKVGDYLKSNCRSWEQDCDNEQDTRELANHLTSKFPTLTSEEAWEVSKHWTGFEEEMNESEIPNPPPGINKAKPGSAEKYPEQFRPSCFKMPMNKKRIHERKIMDFAQFLKTINYRTHDGQSDGSTQRGHGQNLKS